MHLLATFAKDKIEEELNASWTPNFAQADIDVAHALEIWVSSFKDTGEDFSEYRLTVGKCRVLDSKRSLGY